MVTLNEFIEANKTAFIVWASNNNDLDREDRESFLHYNVRQFAYGLRSYSKSEINKIRGELYGALMVKPFFGTRKGVPVDAHIFFGWIDEVLNDYKTAEEE